MFKVLTQYINRAKHLKIKVCFSLCLGWFLKKLGDYKNYIMIELFTVVEVRKYHQLYSNHMDQHCRHEFLAL